MREVVIMMGQRRVANSALAAMLGSVGLKKSTLGSAFCIRMLICKMQISGQVYLDITLSLAYLHEKIHEFRLRHANFGELGEGHFLPAIWTICNQSSSRHRHREKF